MPPAMDIAGTATLLDSLRNLRRRVKLLSVLYGIGIVLSSAVGLLLGVVLLDYLVPLPPIPRAVLNLSTLLVMGYVIWRWIARPAIARLSLHDLAGQIETTFPHFEDTLRSTVNFMGREVPGSAAMQRMTVERAARLAGDVDLGKAVVLRPVWTSLGIGLGAVALLALLIGLVDPDLRRIATDRLFAGTTEWPKRIDFEVDALPARVPAGQDVQIQMKLTKGSVQQAKVMHRYDNGPWQEQIVSVAEDGTFSARLTTRLDASHDLGRLQVKVEAGDDTKELPAVAIVPELELRSATATITPPAYAGAKGEPQAALDHTLDAPVGSEIAFTFEFNRQLAAGQSVKLISLDKAHALPTPQITYPRGGIAVATVKFGANLVGADAVAFTIAATDVDGFSNRSSPTVKVLVREDAKPVLTIENPADKTEDWTAEGLIPLRGVAEDDFGFKYVELVVKGASQNLSTFNKSINLYGGQPQTGVAWQLSSDSTPRLKRFLIGYQWELKNMGVALKPGDRIEYFLRGQDNFALDGAYHDAQSSDHHFINIISRDELIARAEAKANAARQQIEAIKRSVDTDRVTSEEQAKEAREQHRFDDAQKATAARMAEQQNNEAAQTKQVAKQLETLAQQLEENRVSDEGVKKAADAAAKDLNDAADQPMKDAGNKLNDAKDAKSDPKASAEQKEQQSGKAAESLENAAKSQAQASAKLDSAMKKLEEFGGIGSSIKDFEALKAKQDEVAKEYKDAGKGMVGKKPEDLTPDEKKKLDDLTKRQEDLANDTAAALQKMSDKGDKMQKSDPSSSKAMKEAAQAGQQQGIPQKQSNKKDQNGAAEDMEKNQQANAQQRHQEIELGLQTVLDKLNEAKQEQLAKLIKDLAEMKALIDRLVAMQAGHNMDNLLIQDPTGKKLDELSQADLQLLFSDANRDIKKRAELKPDLQELIPGQEQTHRDTLAAAEKAKTLPDATPAGKLNTAATKMEQAAVYLRKSQLADAYQPSQVEALKSLREAQKLVNEAKKQADDEKKLTESEAIRQAYVRLLEAQKVIDADTLRIDGGRDADGNLKRVDANRLGVLPTDQAKIIQDATKLGEKLAALNSIVYKWANKDIVNTMGEVKDDLAKPQTDIVVQAEQTRIEEQLAAMIENLKKIDKKKEFAEAPKGGGSGGKKPPPKMPSDAELRLLRDNQLAINKSTLVVDAAVKKAGGKKDAPTLMRLGGRQGELRGLLDQLVQQATDNKVKLGEEPDEKSQLPEEAKKEDVEQQELENDLLNNKADGDGVEKIIRTLGDRMGRSRQRLANKSDPGEVTQEIQKRIVGDLGSLIELAQKQQQSGQGKPEPGEGDPNGDPKPGDGQGGPQQANGKQPGQQKGGQTAAGESTNGSGSDGAADLSRPLQDAGATWGLITGKDLGAMRNAASEKHSPKYDQYISDYYKELAKKASEQK